MSAYDHRRSGGGGGGGGGGGYRGFDRNRVDYNDVPESRHSVYLRGLPATVSFGEICDYFNDKLGLVGVEEYYRPSRDRLHVFVAIRFPTKTEASQAFDFARANDICGHRVQVTWYRDIMKFKLYQREQTRINGGQRRLNRNGSDRSRSRSRSRSHSRSKSRSRSRSQSRRSRSYSSRSKSRSRSRRSSRSSRSVSSRRRSPSAPRPISAAQTTETTNTPVIGPQIERLPFKVTSEVDNSAAKDVSDASDGEERRRRRALRRAARKEKKEKKKKNKRRRRSSSASSSENGEDRKRTADGGDDDDDENAKEDNDENESGGAGNRTQSWTRPTDRQRAQRSEDEKPPAHIAKALEEHSAQLQKKFAAQTQLAFQNKTFSVSIGKPADPIEVDVVDKSETRIVAPVPPPPPPPARVATQAARPEDFTSFSSRPAQPPMQQNVMNFNGWAPVQKQQQQQQQQQQVPRYQTVPVPVPPPPPPPLPAQQTAQVQVAAEPTPQQQPPSGLAIRLNASSTTSQLIAQQQQQAAVSSTTMTANSSSTPTPNSRCPHTDALVKDLRAFRRTTVENCRPPEISMDISDDGGSDLRLSAFSTGVSPADELEQKLAALTEEQRATLSMKARNMEKELRRDFTTFAHVTRALMEQDPSLESRLRVVLGEALEQLERKFLTRLDDTIAAIVG